MNFINVYQLIKQLLRKSYYFWTAPRTIKMQSNSIRCTSFVCNRVLQSFRLLVHIKRRIGQILVKLLWNTDWAYCTGSKGRFLRDVIHIVLSFFKPLQQTTFETLWLKETLLMMTNISFFSQCFQLYSFIKLQFSDIFTIFNQIVFQSRPLPIWYMWDRKS